MFQQIKNILPNTPINIRSLSESVGLNDTDWNRNLERIGQLRNDFQSLNSFFQSRPNSSQSYSPELDQTDNVSILKELKVTERLLDKLLENVQNIHNANIANFEKAKVADTLIRNLHSSSGQHYEACNLMEKSNQLFEEMQRNLHSIQSKAVDLTEILPQLEKQIDQVSVTHDRNEFELWKRNQEQQLQEEIKAKYRVVHEKKAALEQKFEQFDTIQRQKKIEVYEATFNAQLEDFKRKKETEVSSIYSQHSGSSYHRDASKLAAALNQLRLMDQNNDLDSFLGDTVSSTNFCSDTESLQKKLSNPEPTAKIDNMSLSDDDEDDEESHHVDILEDEDYEEV